MLFFSFSIRDARMNKKQKSVSSLVTIHAHLSYAVDFLFFFWHLNLFTTTAKFLVYNKYKYRIILVF